MYEAINMKDLELVKYLVEKCNADIEHREVQKRSPLYYAASKGEIEITSYLISKGVDVNAKTAMGRCALLKAIWNGQLELVKTLLKHPEINIDVKDSSGRTPLHMAVWGKYGGKF